MKVFTEISLADFEAWNGAQTTQARIIECDKEAEFEAYIDEAYPDGIKENQLNDILWHDSTKVYDILGITAEDEEEEKQDPEEADNFQDFCDRSECETCPIHDPNGAGGCDTRWNARQEEKNNA